MRSVLSTAPLALAALSLALTLFRPVEVVRLETPAGAALRHAEDTVTLYSKDLSRCSWNFLEGRWGGQWNGGELALSDAQLAWDLDGKGKLRAGFVQDSPAILVDLGAIIVPVRGDLGPRTAPVVAPSLWHTLQVERDRFVHLDAFGRKTYFAPADPILRRVFPTKQTLLEPKAGHTYLLRFRKRLRDRDDYVLKILVLAVRPGESITFRWESL